MTKTVDDRGISYDRCNSVARSGGVAGARSGAISRRLSIGMFFIPNYDAEMRLHRHLQGLRRTAALRADQRS
jgi:hypothetical protein